MKRSLPRYPLQIRIAPKLQAGMAALQRVLHGMTEPDPALSFIMAEGDEAILLGGMGELQLDTAIEEIRARGIDLEIGAPEIAYLETIARKASSDFTHKRHQFGKGQFARVILEIEPNSRDGGFHFENRAPAGSIPEVFMSGVERGVCSLLRAGPVMGMPVVDIKAAVLDGAYHETDSSVSTFEIAARAAFREAMALAAPIVLEPVMHVTVSVPADSLGAIIANLHSRRGTVVETHDMQDGCKIGALVPLVNLYGYSNTLRVLTEGRGHFSQSYSHDQPLPGPGDDPGRFPPAVGMRL